MKLDDILTVNIYGSKKLILRTESRMICLCEKYHQDNWWKVWDCGNGLTKVQRNDDKWNFIDKDEKIVSEEWFNDVAAFINGFARVERYNGMMNLIKENGKLVSDEWFDWVEDFEKGFARVRRYDGLYNFINKEGKILSPRKWFRYVSHFESDRFAKVMLYNRDEIYLKNDGILYDLNKNRFPDDMQVNMKKNK